MYCYHLIRPHIGFVVLSSFLNLVWHPCFMENRVRKRNPPLRPALQTLIPRIWWAKPGSGNKILELITSASKIFVWLFSGLLFMAFITLPNEVSTQAPSVIIFPPPLISDPSFYWPSVFKADVTFKCKPSGCNSFSRTNKRVWADVTAGAEVSHWIFALARSRLHIVHLGPVKR